ncbi:C-type lectin domain family 17, member A-like [Strongylocentrotus purpuratus]|uniref:C-type lectin domain-containing protein n=1 Tax=Strongylocentrotus purpuratus TaxID=7668 RepID=A0A7M7PD42_STRPU|nr:C-type lectin domain family 17, member A-like [Strongylocentrotus purpuratus]
MLWGTITVAVVLLVSCDIALSRTETVNKEAASALFSLVESCGAYNCPADWPNRILSLGQTSCYIYSPKKASWAKAKEDCQALGGHLVQFDSESELEVVRSFLTAHYNFAATGSLSWMWTGLNDQAEEGTYRWADVDGQVLADNTMWDQDQPDDDHRLTNMWSGEDCVLFNGVKMNDEVCGDSYPYICEHNPSTSPNTPV